jgi:hypothetical protein
MILQLRLDAENLSTLEKGVHVRFVRLAKGVDGVYELYVEGRGENPFPAPHAEPRVPVVEGS